MAARHAEIAGAGLSGLMAATAVELVTISTPSFSARWISAS